MTPEPDDTVFESSEPQLADRPRAESPPSCLTESHFRFIFLRAAIGIAVTTPEGRILETNPTFEKLTGYTGMELAGMQVLSLLETEDAQMEAALLARVRRGELESFEIEKTLVRKDGERLIVRCVVSEVATPPDGNQLLMLVSDVTAQRRAERALRQKEAMLAEAQAIANVGSWEWDLTTDRLTWTDETYRLYDLPMCSPVTFQDWFNRLVPEEQPGVRALLDRALRDHQPFSFEHTILRPNGERRTLQGRGRVTVDGQGRPFRMHGTAQDITERKRHLEALHERKAQLAEAQRIAHLGNWTWDIPSDRVRGSKEYFRIFGLPPDTDEVPLAEIVARVHPEDRPALLGSIKRARNVGDPSTFEFRIVRPDGQVRHVEAHGYTRAREGDRPSQRFGTIQDVTERHEIERAKDEFISVVSHELRTPLTSIRAPLLMLAAGKIDPQTPHGRSLLELAVSNTERMVRLVNDIMDMERLARGRLSLKREPVEGLALARQAAGALEAEADRADVTLAVEGQAAPLSADAQRIVQVLTNLLDNAIDFSPPGGTVRLHVEPTGDRVRFTVHDEGPGIPEDQLETIFNRFKQLDTSTTRKKQGLGLGLPISRGIVEQHGGRLWADSRPGAGATFVVELPIHA